MALGISLQLSAYQQLVDHLLVHVKDTLCYPLEYDVKRVQEISFSLQHLKPEVLVRLKHYILEESTKFGTDPCLGSGSNFTRGATNSDVTVGRKLIKYNTGVLLPAS